ncbi:MAG: CDP-alcohol phosphatidyltransferase family protein [Gemmatimonadales bacterium]|nr:CDP-alcohol phosphatidyltransferase family protein [Gemmatimonadales bacterium]
MLDHWLRGWKDRLLAPFARRVGRHVGPGAVSMAGLLVGLGAALALSRGATGTALVMWLMNRFLDGLDGSMARETGQSTDFGGYLDIICDFVVYAAIPLALALARPDLALTVGVLLGTFYVNAASWMYLAAVLERRGRGAASTGEVTQVTMPAGLVGGTETVVLFAVAIAVPGATAVTLGVMSALVAVTTIQRLAWAGREL